MCQKYDEKVYMNHMACYILRYKFGVKQALNICMVCTGS